MVDAGYNQIGYFNASFNADGKVCLQINIENTEYTNLLECISNTIETLRSDDYNPEEEGTTVIINAYDEVNNEVTE